MAINPVTSGPSYQPVRPQPQADNTEQTEQAQKIEQAKQARQSEQIKPTEEPKAKPVVNTQGQTTGNSINTTS